MTRPAPSAPVVDDHGACPSCGARFDAARPLDADGNTTIRSRTHAAGCPAPDLAQSDHTENPT